MESTQASPDHVADRFAGWCWPRPITDSYGTWIKSYMLLAASYLTDPVCKIREYSWQLAITKEMQPNASETELEKTKWLLHLGRIACGGTALVTTVPGVIIRSLSSYLQSEPYIHLKGTEPAKVLPKLLQESSISVYSANRANQAAGYVFTDAGVTPWTHRIDAHVAEIKDQNADVVCLSELFDPSASFYLYEELKKLGYTDFYFNMGYKAIAPGSGLFVASKYAIQNPEFTAFPEATLQGRTKWACKGFFRFDIASQNDVIARIYTTHLQHSEEPEFPNRNPKITDITQEVIKKALTEDCQDDVIARAAQMHLIVQDMIKNSSSFTKPVVLVGDLNLDPEEKEKSLWNSHFGQGILHYHKKKTWGGDKFCVDLVNGKTGKKKVSGPLDLDYALVFKNGAATIETWLVDAKFDGTKFELDAVSDHSALKSVIYFKA